MNNILFFVDIRAKLDAQNFYPVCKSTDIYAKKLNKGLLKPGKIEI
jgi:hypothetical protein